MSIYNLSEKGINEVPRTLFQNHGILERGHLQSYLRDKIEIISPDTLIISEEFSQWDDSKRRIDLLGIDKQANLVVIELKRNDSGDHMELQALRYASMVSAMTFENCVSIYQAYIERRRLDLDAERELLLFLDWEAPVQEDFAKDVRLVLASADFSKELTSSVLWLRKKKIDIFCVRITPYAYNQELFLDVSQIIPLPESEDYLVKLREKEDERQKAISAVRDKTKYVIDGVLLSKNRFVLKVIEKYLKENPSTFKELKALFPKKMQGSTGVINSLDFIEKKYQDKPDKRHFVKHNEVLLSSDNIQFAVSTEWSIGNIGAIEEFAKSRGIDFEKISKD